MTANRRPLILVVEDNTADAVIIREAVEAAGPEWPTYRLHHARDLHSALEAMDDESPDCVLLDLGLPDTTDMDGVERLHEARPELPIVVITGVDDHAVARQAIRHGAQDFVRKSAELSPELMARTITHAIERAEAHQAVLESNKALGSFASMVAHDLRSPLAIASGMLELVLRQGTGELGDDLTDLVQRSARAIQRAGDLVGSLLMYAKAKHMDEVATPMDLADVVRDAARVAAVAEDGGKVTTDETLPSVTAGEGALRQVFQNLFANSVAYADPDRAPAIHVTARAVAGAWEISVIDNGQGIPPDKTELVFAEGERLSASGPGLGLGLAAVRAIIERHGGRVWVTGRDDGLPGTAVRLTLPGLDGDG